MQAGKLRYTVVVTEPSTSTRDESGQPLAGAARFVLRTKAEIVAVTGKEVYTAGAGFSGQLSHRVTIRKPRTAIRNGMTVVFGTRRFLVQFARDPDERGRELDIFCLEQE